MEQTMQGFGGLKLGSTEGSLPGPIVHYLAQWFRQVEELLKCLALIKTPQKIMEFPGSLNS